MAKKMETGWAIVSGHGLYVGWHMCRREMIAQHVDDLVGAGRFVHGGKLDEAQTRAWKDCRRNGDRAVKVSLTYDAL